MSDRRTSAAVTSLLLVAATITICALPPSRAAAACPVKPLPTGKSIGLDGAPRLVWPVRGRLIVEACSNGSERRFNGIDIAAPEGTAVKAAADGTVLYAGSGLKSFRQLVVLLHPGDWVTVYAFNSKLVVAGGDRVRQGQTIARSGRAPATGVEELHFEVRRQDRPVDPVRLLPAERRLGVTIKH